VSDHKERERTPGTSYVCPYQFQAVVLRALNDITAQQIPLAAFGE